MKKMLKQVTVFLVLGWGLSPVMATTSTVLTMSPEKRLKATIAQDSMNRLTVENDRITQVFGDEESYILQAEEHTGQIFLKPTADNGDKPLSLTLMTENGLTQDLTLELTQKGATTLILKPSSSQLPQNGEVKGRRGGAGFYPSDSPGLREEGGSSLPEHLVQAIKNLIAGQGVVLEMTESQRQAPEGFQVTFKQAYQVGTLKGFQFEVTNTTDTPIEIEEKAFFQPNDLALSFKNRVLSPQGSTLLTVVSR